MATREEFGDFLNDYDKALSRVTSINNAVSAAQADLQHTRTRLEISVDGQVVYGTTITLQAAYAHIQAELSVLQAELDRLQNILNAISLSDET